MDGSFWKKELLRCFWQRHVRSTPVELWDRDRLLQAVGLEGGDDAKNDADDGGGVEGGVQNLALTSASNATHTLRPGCVVVFTK